MHRMKRMLSLAPWLFRHWMTPVWIHWQRRWRSSIGQSRAQSWSGRHGCSARQQQNWLRQLRCRQTARRHTGRSIAGHRLSVSSCARIRYDDSGNWQTMTDSRHGTHFLLCGTDFAASVKDLEGTGVVLHDFDGADEQELTVFAEQQVPLLQRRPLAKAHALRLHPARSSFCSCQVTLHHEADGWIMCSTEAGRKGLVPATYIRVIKTKPRDDPFAATDDAFGADDPFAGMCGAPCCVESLVAASRLSISAAMLVLTTMFVLA